MVQDREDRKVTFQQRLPARVSAVLDQMVECLHTTGHYDVDLEVCIEYQSCVVISIFF